ncbi:MAG: hypothetical protein D6772_05265, partial [Bacteroidetes bacterium]
MRISTLLIVGLLFGGGLWGQHIETTIKVYDFDDGLSHRNVFQIVQDSNGLIWIATINGLNRFDGYHFTHLSTKSPELTLPTELVSDLILLPDGQLALASPDYLSFLSPQELQLSTIQIKPGEIKRRESFIPQQLAFAYGHLWCTVYDERVGHNWLATFTGGKLKLAQRLRGSATKRPMVVFKDQLYLGAAENELWLIRPDTRIETRLRIGEPTADNPQPRIVELQGGAEGLYVLLNDGRLYALDSAAAVPQLLRRPPAAGRYGTFLLEEDGDLWLGGLGILEHYDTWTQRWENLDIPIRQQLRNTCTYRSIFKDRSGTIWLATDFGAVEIVQSDKLFSQYLSGGSEYCSNVYCSMRGITEDEAGRIYLSYYNSIHVLAPEQQALYPLFPNDNYFNYPFGLTYHAGALYTGNGIRIDLNTLARDTLFRVAAKDLGVVIVDQDEELWFGYEHQLLRYEPTSGALRPFQDSQGQWDSLAGTISYLYESPYSGDIWVGTLDNGLYRIAKKTERDLHLVSGRAGPLRLPSSQVNALLETGDGSLWVGTAEGLVRLAPDRQSLQLYGTTEGLPNAFINGILAESDTVLWVSTNYGLSRFTPEHGCHNFFTDDGLSANEFNRNSFYKARDGRMYFGGLDGVNAFTPSERLLAAKVSYRTSPLLFTGFDYLAGAMDSLVHLEFAHRELSRPLWLEHQDRMFTAHFALLDFRQPDQHIFQCILEGYEKDWEEPQQVPYVRYTDLPPGDYVLRVRARTGREAWNPQMLSIPIHIQPAYYQRWWFWPLVALLTLSLLIGLMQYRVYMLDARRRELERQVDERTRELQAEQQKSEELLLNILPAGLAQELKENGFAKAKRHDQVTVMFSDFKDFSRISNELEPEELVAEIDLC